MGYVTLLLCMEIIWGFRAEDEQKSHMVSACPLNRQNIYPCTVNELKGMGAKFRPPKD